MKTILLFITGLFYISTYAQPGGNRNGYSRDGATTTLKQMDYLFTEPFLFSKGSLQVDGGKSESKPAVMEAIAASDNVIKDFEKSRCFLQSKPSAQILKSKFNTVVSKANGLSGAVEKAADGYTNWRSIASVYFLQELYLYQAYIAAAVKVYPEAISLQEKLEQANEAIKKYGSKESYIAKIEKNNLDYLKSLRMKKAVISNPAIEKMVKTQYENWASNDKVTVTLVHITSDWVIEKNVFDIPLHKEVQVNMAAKKADGSCGFASGYVRQTYEGGGKYSAASLIMPSPVVVVPCENLSK